MHSAIKIANRFLQLSGDPVASDMTPMKLLKLVYIAHGWTLGLTGRRLISEDIEAWQYGPVIPELYRDTRAYRNTPVLSLPEAGNVILEINEESIVTQVFQKYGSCNGLQLSAMTHKDGTPWSNIWASDPGGVIPRESIQAYYERLAGNA